IKDKKGLFFGRLGFFEPQAARASKIGGYFRPSLTDLYDWADVLLLLSDYEGLPLTILEAMRQGVVVIATDVGAVSEVLNDDVGYIVNPSTRAPDTIAALSEIIRDKKILATKGRAAAERMAAMSWEISAAALITQLDEKFLARNATSLA
ncbi:glycosyltransferase, partial [Pseudomonas putida]